MEYSCTTVRDTYGPICHVVKDRDEYLFRMIDRDEAEQLVNMLNELARLREATRWRSVGKELPEVGEWVLLLDKYRYVTSGYLEDDGKWLDMRSIHTVVTHWQPLPETLGGG